MNKAKTAAIIVTVIMIASMIMMAIQIQPVQAQYYKNMQDAGGMVSVPAGVTPDYTITKVLYLSVSPSPIGLGQNFLVNFFFVPAFNQEHFLKDIKVSITKPDGSTDEVLADTYMGDLTGWFEYPADQVGEWTWKASFDGAYFPAGNYSSGQSRRGGILNPLLNDTLTISYPYSKYLKPSETQQDTIVTVQADMVWSWPAVPLPTDYWTRPVPAMNREWWSILGSTPWYGPGGGPNFPADTNLYAGGYGLTPYSQGPGSAHILRKELRTPQTQGLVGAYTTLDPTTASALTWASAPSPPSIFYGGYTFGSRTKSMEQLVNGSIQVLPTSMFECRDIRTGEVLWERTASSMNTPTYLVYEAGSGDVPGAAAIRGQEVYLTYIGGGRLVKYNVDDGSTALNVSLSPITSGTMFQNGWLLTVQDLGVGATNATGGRYRLLNWTCVATSANLTSRIVTNTTYARSSLPSTVDFQAGYGVTTSSPQNPSTLMSDRLSYVQGYKLSTGEMLWNVSWPEQTYQGLQVDHGMAAQNYRNGYYVAYDLASGKVMWQSDPYDYPWSLATFGAYGSNSGYGLLIFEAYDGVYAFNWSTGKIQWKYKAPAVPFETPYTDENGFQVHAWDDTGLIADGKMYVTNSEHSETQPLTRGWALHCIDMRTGKGIWNLTGEWGVGVVGDGYLTASNNYDGYMYVIGKGKSATTVTAPDVAVPLGTSFTIKGTVLDQSPGSPNTPCVAKASMTTQMNYLHMQYPIAGIFGNETITGVPVALSAVDENGTVIDLGTVVSNGYFGTFSKTWTPPKEGKYEIMAYFSSDDSYGSSKASCAVAVGPAPEPIEFPPTTEPTDYSMQLNVTLAAVIVAIIIGIVAVLLALRKH